MTMIECILDIKKDKSVLWRWGKSKKEVLTETIAAFDGLCAGRAYLPSSFLLEEVLGVAMCYPVKNMKIGLSVNQMRHYIRYVVKTGKTLKRPYLLPNTDLY